MMMSAIRAYSLLWDPNHGSREDMRNTPHLGLENAAFAKMYTEKFKLLKFCFLRSDSPKKV
jgi:hypothetical protein